MKHISVLLEETVDYLNLNENSIVVDMTLGFGGHSKEILKRIPKGFLYAFDQDQTAIDYSSKLLSEYSNFEIIKTNFVNIKKELEKRNVIPDAIVFDLGVSSPQLDEKARGFSFHSNSVLDMRMDQTSTLTAHYIVNNYEKEKLEQIFFTYGEEKYSKSIAKAIVRERDIKRINTTEELVEIIKRNVPEKYKREKHPARKIFQALRIEVNNELEVFEKALTDSLEIINIGGRIGVITFHSLEDKICKKKFKLITEINDEFKKLPVIPDEYLPNYKIIKNIKPSKEEVEENRRARSSKLRVIERVK